MPRGEYKGRFLSTRVASGQIFVSDPYITLFYVGFCLNTIFNIYCWYINMELTGSSTIHHDWTKLILTHISSPDGTPCGLLVLKNTRQHFKHYVWAIFNSKIINQKHTMWKAWHKKDICLQYQGWNKQEVHFVWPCWECVHWAIHICHCSSHP